MYFYPFGNFDGGLHLYICEYLWSSDISVYKLFSTEGKSLNRRQNSRKEPFVRFCASLCIPLAPYIDEINILFYKVFH